MSSEFDFIERIRQRAATQLPSAGDLVFGIGDDAAAWCEQAGRETLITVDLLVEDVDFKLDYVPPRWLGHKTLAVSLSDIAAMGGAPKYALLTLAIPPSLKSQISNSESEIFWQEFFAGYFALAEAHGVQLIGGDISSAPDRLMVDSVVIGQCPRGRAVRRDGAKEGDTIYVTGALGASAAGLKLLLAGERVDEMLIHRRGAESAEEAQREGKTSVLPLRSLRLCGEWVSPDDDSEELKQSAMRAHLRPEPRVEFGGRLGELALASAIIDVSDGLAQDLKHICEASHVAALLDFDAVPIAAEVTLVTQKADEAFELAVSGGEDFELLFTANRNHEAALFELAADCRLKLSRIGEVVPADSATAVWLRRDGQLKPDLKPLLIRGYDHFNAP